VLYEQVTSQRALRSAWHRVRQRQPVPGADGVTVGMFEADADTHLGALRAEVLEGRYAPLPLRRIFLRKEDGSERPVALPALRDRIVQDSLLHALRSPIDRVLGESAHAYRVGRSALTALEAVQEALASGLHYVLKGDIAQFFDTLDHGLLRSRLAETIGEDPVVELVMRSIGGLVLDEMSLWENRVGAPQGLSLSPLLSNLYMAPFDLELQAAGLTLVRYADDFVVFCGSPDEAARAEQTARDLLVKLRLRPKNEKWSVVSITEGFVFLGYHIDDRGRGPSHKAVEALLWRLEEAQAGLAKYHASFERQVEAFRPVIRGWLGYFETLPRLEGTWDSSMVAAAALELAAADAFDEAADALTRHIEAHGSSLNVPTRLGLADVAEGLGLMWLSLRERALALRAEPKDPQARAALAGSLGGDEHVEPFLAEMGKLLAAATQDERDEQAWPLAEFLISRGCQGAAYQMLDAEGAQRPVAASSGTGAASSTSAAPAAPPGANSPQASTPAAPDEDIAVYLSLFGGQAGYAEEILADDGRRVHLHVDAPLDAPAVQQHLRTERTLAIHLRLVDGTVKTWVLDVDVGKRGLILNPPGSPGFYKMLDTARTDAMSLAAALRDHGVPAYVEWTGRRGYHVWVFLDKPVSLAPARQALRALADSVPGPPDGITREILPQEPQGRDATEGTAVKLPLGAHVQTGEMSYFLDGSGQPVSSPWTLLREVARASADTFLQLAEECGPVAADRLPKPQTPRAVPAIASALPDGPVKQVVAGCPAVASLVEKARRTGYLNHQERVTLLLVLGHLGPAGKAFLEEVMRWCLNYDAAITHKFMRRLFGKPVSCGKLGERHPELAAGLRCDCRFHLSKGMYPSPILHAVAGTEADPHEIAPEGAGPAAEVAAGSDEASPPLPTRLDRLAKLRFGLSELEAAVRKCQAMVDELLKTADSKG
jgi:RNA-directed DNA polymerase